MSADSIKTAPSDMRRSVLAGVLAPLARLRRLRRLVLRIVLRIEGGQFYSLTARDLMREHYGLEIGDYTYGECFRPGSFPPGVVCGRYVAIASGAKVFLRNKPVDRLVMHPFFYNAKLGWVKKDNIDSSTLEIGHDAWLGERCIITPSCRRVGIGAVIGAGAVVTKDVPDFAIVGGNPATIIRYRFSPELQERVLRSEWWSFPVRELMKDLRQLERPLDPNSGELPKALVDTKHEPEVDAEKEGIHR